MGKDLTKHAEIQLDLEDKILTVTFNRPEVLNAFGGDMSAAFIEALDLADADDGIRAVILTGTGRAFCAGADLSKGADTFDYDAQGRGAGKADEVDWSDERVRDGGGHLTLRLFKSLKPIISAINGPAVGMGATITLATDLRLASEKARFGFVFSRRGLVPEACSTWFLPRAVGIQKTLEWCYSGRVFGAQEALDAGLVRSLHKPDDLIPDARELAREIADNASPVAVATMRQMVWHLSAAPHPMEAHKIDSKAIYALGQGPDVKEGVSSFLEKRPPQFSSSVASDMPPVYPWWDEPKYE